MSEQDQDKIIGRLTKRLFWRMGVPILVILIAQFAQNSMKASDKYVESHYTELYKQNAELNVLMTTYIGANDREKDQLWSQIERALERMDMHVDKNVTRGGYGKEFTPILE